MSGEEVDEEAEEGNMFARCCYSAFISISCTFIEYLECDKCTSLFHTARMIIMTQWIQLVLKGCKESQHSSCYMIDGNINDVS